MSITSFINFAIIIALMRSKIFQEYVMPISGARGISKPMSATCMNMEG